MGIQIGIYFHKGMEVDKSKLMHKSSWSTLNWLSSRVRFCIMPSEHLLRVCRWLSWFCVWRKKLGTALSSASVVLIGAHYSSNSCNSREFAVGSFWCNRWLTNVPALSVCLIMVLPSPNTSWECADGCVGLALNARSLEPYWLVLNLVFFVWFARTAYQQLCAARRLWWDNPNTHFILGVWFSFFL